MPVGGADIFHTNLAFFGKNAKQINRNSIFLQGFNITPSDLFMWYTTRFNFIYEQYSWNNTCITFHGKPIFDETLYKHKKGKRFIDGIRTFQ